MTAHIQGPWRTDAAGGFPNDIHDAAGELLARVVPEAGADVARRIVACVNTCAGMSTAALEHHASLLQTEDYEFFRLMRQRDELLAALETIVSAADGVICQGGVLCIDDASSPWLAEARSAIAKAKGGAA